MKKLFYIFPLFLLAAVSLLSSCTDIDEPRQPEGPRTYRMRLLADIDIPGAADTRAAYAFPDKSQIYVLFQQGSSPVTGTAVYNAASGIWTITPSQSLTEVVDGACQLSYLIDAGQASSTSVAITQSTRIYKDATATYTLSDDLLTVQGHFTPTLGRIRFLGKAGQTYTFTGLALATAFDLKKHTINNVATKLTATCASNGYTPYFYATFADPSARQLTFELTSTTGLRRAFGENVLQAGVSGYITIPTVEKHEGWTLVNLSTGKEITFGTVSKPTASQIYSNKATLTATVTSNGGGTISETGFVIATHATPTTSDRRISCGKQTSLSSVVTELSQTTKYYVRAFVINEMGIAYGEEITFTTGSAENENSSVEREDWGSEVNWDNDGGIFCPDANHPHAIDLGIGIKFACCNVGADSPTGYGNYYAWGETSTKSQYDWSTYKWCNGTYYSMTKYCTDSKYGIVDNKTTLEPSEDAARANWGSSWRMPTYAELKKLIEQCTWTWVTVIGVNGYRVTASNGNSIFFPAVGHCDGTGLNNVGSYGYYWSSSLSTDSDNYAQYLYFGSRGCYMYGFYRCLGRSVRPVTE